MGYLKSILDEEYRRLKALVEKYLTEINQFPKGSVSLKKRGEREYLYLSYRRGGKVISEYVGSVTSEKAKRVLKQIERRKLFEKKLRQAAENLAEVEKALHG